jgi:hypothetical protein
MEFFDINLTKSRLLLNDIHSPFYWWILKKTYSSLDLKSLQKIRETRKLESTHEYHFVDQKNEDRNPTKTGV